MILVQGFWLIVVAILIAFVASVIDWRVLKNRAIHNHSSRVVIRGLFFFLFSIAQNYNVGYPEVFIVTILGVALQAFVFWISFDIILNLMRGLKPLYIGSVAELDKKFKRVPYMQFIAKGFGLIVSALSYYSSVEFY